MTPGAAADGDDLVDDLGHRVVVPAVPERIVSLVPSISETLVSWGLADRIVGVTEWCVSPPRAFEHAARVRGTKNPDIATIVELRPDVVVANEEENRRSDVERLRAADIEVWVTAPRALADVATSLERLRAADIEVWVTAPRALADVATSLERLGAVIGAAAPAGRLADAIRGALGGAAHARRVLGGGLRTFCPIWRDPWISVGTDTIAADLLHHAGFDVVPAMPRYPRVELDDVAALDPDVVLLPDEPYEFDAGDAEVFAGWRASVRLVDGATLTWWGPRTPAALATFTALARRVGGRAR